MVKAPEVMCRVGRSGAENSSWRRSAETAAAGLFAPSSWPLGHLIRSLEETKERNERIKQDTVRQFVEDTQRTVKENELGIKRAKANFEADTKMWEQECLRLEQEWLSKAEEGIEATKVTQPFPCPSPLPSLPPCCS